MPVVIDLAEEIAEKEWNGLTAAKHHIREITPALMAALITIALRR